MSFQKGNSFRRSSGSVWWHRHSCLCRADVLIRTILDRMRTSDQNRQECLFHQKQTDPLCDFSIPAQGKTSDRPVTWCPLLYVSPCFGYEKHIGAGTISFWEIRMTVLAKI